ncbi:hypothetical protein [Synechococcus sp. GEYO]|uniref:hypothetical protein n=1 Tax=Synechococcus sp. GEYO TaxID=2575511 RepID=UPI0010BDA509|nr:hypothetical protein [Synechococcus sp. GEYO]
MDSRARVVMGSAVAGLIGVVALAVMEGLFNPAQADQVYLRCDVSGLDGTIWEITLDEKAGKAWVYKPEFRSSTEYPASFTPEHVRFGKELPYTGSYLSNVLDRSTGDLTSDIRGLAAPPLTATCEIQAKTTPTV